jgi:hypothetical protein
MKRWKKRLFWVGGAVLCPAALYFLTAPFMLDILWARYWEPKIRAGAYKASFSWKFYAPARAAVTRHWLGRRAYNIYCYDVCHMGLLMPMEVSHDEE